MARRTVAEELRRVLARLGGTPAIREVPEPDVPVHRTELCAARAAPLTVAIAAATGRVGGPEAVPRSAGVAIAATEGRGVAAVLAAGPVRVAGVRPDPPAVRAGSLAAVLGVHAGRASDLTTGARAVRLCAAEARPAHRPLDRVAHGRVGPLPPLVAVGARPSPDGPLMLARRRRVDWGLIDRARLARDWARVLRDHGHPAEDVQLVGVFGPVALAAVGSVALTADGRLAVRLVRPRLPGPAGDVVIARHGPSGALLRSDVA